MRVRLFHRQHAGGSGCFMTRGYLTGKRLRALALGVHNTRSNVRVLYFILIVSTVHSIVKIKVTVFLQYFCHNVLHSSCCGGHCSLLPLFSTKELVDFVLFYFYFICGSLVYSMITAARLTAPISGVPALISEEFIRGKRKDCFFFQPKLLKKQFAL